jgi:hypothetical protein
MRRNALLAVALAVAAASIPAHAEDDLDLAPLVPVARPKPKPAAPKPPPKPKAPVGGDDDLLAPLAPAPRVQQAAAPQLLVKLEGNVQGATWSVDGRDKGPVTGSPVETTAGEHTVTVRAQGFQDFTKRIKAGPGVTTVAVVLEPAPGLLYVTVSPSDAEVFVDGTKVGRGNVKAWALDAGDHTVSVRRKNMREYEEVVAIVAGAQKQLSVELKPLGARTGTPTDRPEPRKLTPAADPVQPDPLVAEAEVESAREPAWYQRWYVWAGVAVVAAGATVGVMAANRTEPPPTSTSVCDGVCDAVVNLPPGTTFRF